MFARTLLALGCVAALWSSTAVAADEFGYLQPNEQLNIAAWLPAAPAPGSAIDASDYAIYFQTRALVAGSRGQEAVADNVYAPADIALRFEPALGVALTSANAKVTLQMMQRVTKDQENLLSPIKKPVTEGGRLRPYVLYPDQPACPHQIDDEKFHLSTSGSYPSGHTTLGWIWALILSDLAPERTDALLAKGHAFGESRVVCGFHYNSDLVGGRVAAAALFARLQTDPDFISDMAVARQEVTEARAGVAIRASSQLQNQKKQAEKRPVPAITPE